MLNRICPTCGQVLNTPERQLRETIRQRLADRDMTQAELAERLGITQKHMSSLLTGKTALSLDWAERILNVLGGTINITVKVNDE